MDLNDKALEIIGTLFLSPNVGLNLMRNLSIPGPHSPTANAHTSLLIKPSRATHTGPDSCFIHPVLCPRFNASFPLRLLSEFSESSPATGTPRGWITETRRLQLPPCLLNWGCCSRFTPISPIHQLYPNHKFDPLRLINLKGISWGDLTFYLFTEY